MVSLHNAEELRQLSTYAHWVIGYIFLAVFIFALLESLGVLKSEKSRYIWPAFASLAGIFLVPYLLLHHGLDKVGATLQVFRNDAQQMQHLIMGILILIASGIELLHRANKLPAKAFGLAFPIALVIIGLMFLFHPQHGSHEAMMQSMRYHTWLGSVIILTGLLRGTEVLAGVKQPWLRYAWLVPLLITSMMLITYSEPEGAYQDTITQPLPGQSSPTTPHHVQ